MAYASAFHASRRARWPAQPIFYIANFLAGLCAYSSCVLIGTILHITSPAAAPLTLEQAWQQAEQANPTLQEVQG